jgi:hypothetical protein
VSPATVLQHYPATIISRELGASVTYEVFLPGAFIENSGPGEIVHFVEIELLFRV